MYELMKTKKIWSAHSGSATNVTERLMNICYETDTNFLMQKLNLLMNSKKQVI